MTSGNQSTPRGRTSLLRVALALGCVAPAAGCQSQPLRPAGPSPAAGSAQPVEALRPPASPSLAESGAAESGAAGTKGVGIDGGAAAPVLVPAIQGGERCGTGVCDVQEVCCHGACPSCVPVGAPCDVTAECTPG